MAIVFKLSAARQGDWWQGLTSCTAYSAQKPSLQTDADLPTPSQRSSIQGFYHARESHHNPKAVAHGRPRGSKSPSPSGTKKWPSYRPQKLDPHAVPPTVGGTARGSSILGPHISRLRGACHCLLRMDDHATLAHIETKLLHVYHVLNSSILASKSA